MVEMPYGTPWFDFIVVGDIKVQVKGRRLSKRPSGSTCWKFTHIDYNNKTDYFLLIGYNGEQEDGKLKILSVWLFYKNDIIRGAKFYDRESFTITNEYKYMVEFRRYNMDGRIKDLGDIILTIE